jgi:cytochrome c oxidase cbb3-type subunit 3
MRLTIGAGCIAALLVGSIAGQLVAQGGAAPPPAPDAAPAAGAGGQGAGRGGGRGGRGGPGRGFPAQQRELADQATLDRGKLLYEINCRSCHGPDLRGGETGGPNLLRSDLALKDQHGELIIPVVRQGQQTPGMTPMPAMQLPDADIVAIAEYIHGVQASARGQGAPPAGPPVELNIVVGNAQAGQAYFARTCTACHTLQSMQGIATRIPNPMQLQNAWVAGGGRGGRGGRGAGGGTSEVTVTVTLPDGRRFEGPLVRIDDFIVVITMPDGTDRSFARSGDVPRVDINDPRRAHRNLLSSYTDTDMHNVTAFLVTLK